MKSHFPINMGVGLWDYLSNTWQVCNLPFKALAYVFLVVILCINLTNKIYASLCITHLNIC